jgi:hypothetical protein
MALPPFGLLSTAYPNYWLFPNPQAVRKLIGGEVQDPDITNTCTIRMSHAMNAAGIPIPQFWQRITNRRGSNKRYYIVRVTNFRSWMEHTFGAPSLDFRKTGGEAFDRQRIKGFRGVIAFEIGFTDATGHFDLWYQDRFSHEDSAGKDYFALASRVSLWHDGSRSQSAPV